MTNRELLELAAKAAGIELCWVQNEDGIECSALPGVIPWILWNPLTDDGDALRLAVKLLIAIDPCDTWCIGAGATIVFNGDSVDICEPQDGGDLCTATRRAIVRAAAEIGKNPK